jgi:transcriptional enhancer factor
MKQQGNDEHPSKLAVAFNSSGIPARMARVRCLVASLTHSEINPDLVVLQLIFRQSIGEAGSSSQSESSFTTSISPSPPLDLHHSVPAEQEHTYVKILLQDDLWPAPPPTIQLVGTDANHPQSIQLSPTPYPSSGTTSRNKLNILPSLSGAMEFSSSFALLSQSTVLVYVEGSTLPIHSGVAPLNCISSPMQRSGWLYSVDLVPSIRKTLGS